MKRATSSPQFDDGRRLKRANSSLFSIATLVDDDDNTLPHNSSVSLSRLMGEKMPNVLVVEGSVTEEGDALCFDSDDSCANVPEEAAGGSKIQIRNVENRSPPPSSKAAAGLIDINETLQGAFDESPAPLDDGVSSSCSSSEDGAAETTDIDVDCATENSTTNSKVGSVKKMVTRQNAFERSEPDEKAPPQPNNTIKNVSLQPSTQECMAAMSHCLPCSTTFLPNKSVKDLQKLKQFDQMERRSVVDTTTIIETNPKNERRNSCDNHTGLVFESGSMHFDRHNRFHKERPLRITSVHDHLSKLKPGGDDSNKSILERCHLLESRENRGENRGENVNETPEDLWLDDDDYLRVHLPGYMQRLDRISKCNCDNRLDIEAEQFKSIYFTSDSVREAKAAASSLCLLVSDVVSGRLDNGFAVIRPPGHHAEPSLAGGYCVINNVAVAAAYARDKLGAKKVLIVDWDVHHGNGTQKCFIRDPNVLYFSVHRYHGGNFFPFLDHGGPTNIGNGLGKGRNINVGWNDKKMGDDEYLVVWEKLLMPIANEFNPDLVLVSSGFDAARGDMGECDVTPECFARLTRRLKTLANGKVVFALEGGYVRSVLCKCVESVLLALLDVKSDEKCKEELRVFHSNLGELEMLDCINPSAAKSIQETIKVHSEYWNCLK